MSKHKHYDMIVAKAANMDLIVFCNYGDGWRKLSGSIFPSFCKGSDYFLCLPEHKEACLHWLNGGECQLVLCHEDDWLARATPKIEFGDCRNDSIWMKKNKIRIKPRKEKRWIGIHPLGATTPLGKTEKFVSDIALHQLVDAVKPFCEWQFIEIEVEV